MEKPVIAYDQKGNGCGRSPVFYLKRNIVIGDGIRPAGHTRIGLPLEIVGIGSLSALVLLVSATATLAVSTALVLLIAAATLILVSTALVLITAATTLVVSPSAEKLEVVDNNLCDVMGLTVFLIVPGLESAFDIDGASFGQIFFADFGLFTENDDSVPFGFLLAFPGVSVCPLFAGGNGEIHHRCPLLGIADLGIPSEVADEHDLVQTCHYFILLVIRVAIIIINEELCAQAGQIVNPGERTRSGHPARISNH